MRFILTQLSVAITLLILVVAFEARAAVTGTINLPNLPEPKGYDSRQAVMAAIFKKEIELIQPPSTFPPNVKEIKEIEYGRIGNRSLHLDLYLPDTISPDKPSLLFIHGGAWSGGSRDVYKYYTVHFAKLGYIAATASYRLSGEASYPAAVHDTKCAVRWMRANATDYGINPKQIVAIGGSAGGHLSLMLGYSPDATHLEGTGGHEEYSSAVQAVVNFYGPVDLTTKMGQESGSVRKFLDDKTYTESPSLYEDASPLFHLKEGAAPPTLTIHGTLDETVEIAQGDMLEAKLKKLGIPYGYARLEGWPHTLDAAKHVNAYCTQLIEGFLKETFPPKP
jgi:acetyl esterase/lipase